MLQLRGRLQSSLTVLRLAASSLADSVPNPNGLQQRAWAQGAAESHDELFEEEEPMQQPQRDGQRGGRGPVGRRPPAPIDRPRTLDDYNRLLAYLAKRHKSYLMRDVLDEMSLNGVRPNGMTYFTGLFSAMKARKLGEAMYFWQEMQRHGFQPDTRAYTAIISACGRCGQVQAAVDFKAEMEAKGLPLSRHTYLALLNAFSAAGKLASARTIFDEMAQKFQPDEFAYAALINCYRNMHRRNLPEDADKQLLALLEEARAGMGNLMRSEWDDSYNGLGLITYNAVLNSLSELGYHQQTLELFEWMRENAKAGGVAPDVTSYMNVARSHLRQALGCYTQPDGEALTAIIEERLQDVDLAPFYAQIEEEDRRVALAFSSRATGSSNNNSSSEAEAEEVEEEEGPVSAAAAAAAAKRDVAVEVEGAPLEAAAATSEDVVAGLADEQAASRASRPGTAAVQQQQQRRQSGRKSREEVMRERAENRARSKLRFEVFRQHIDLEEWYKALHLYQEVLDKGLHWGPDITYAMVQASLDMSAAGVEDAMAVAHTLLDRFEQSGLFVDVGTGTDLMILAVRRDVEDLSVAHRLWDLLRKSGRVPRTRASYKYLRALVSREPEHYARISEVCLSILMDPDNSAPILKNKAEAAMLRSALPPPYNGRQQSQQSQQQQQQQQQSQQSQQQQQQQQQSQQQQQQSQLK